MVRSELSPRFGQGAVWHNVCGFVVGVDVPADHDLVMDDAHVPDPATTD
jgi:hypothetical protein